MNEYFDLPFKRPFNMRLRLKLLLSLLCFLVLNVSQSNAEISTAPNIILILADDVGAECFNTYGGVSYDTPNINHLAAQGMQFDNFYSQPKCTHTRIELLTGKYNSRNYVGFVTLGSSQQFTVADLLKIANYRTGVIGKWQLGYPFQPEDPRVEVLPPEIGFDHSQLWTAFALGNWFEGATLHSTREYQMPRGLRFARHRPGYGPNIINRQVLKFIRDNHDKPEPFFLYYPMRLPHAPFCPAPNHPDYPMWDVDDIQYFPSMMKHMDRMVGRVVAEVNNLGIANNTLIIFLGDNGTNRRITSQLSDGTLVQGGKGKPNVRAGMHVPFIAKWPGTIAPGSRSNTIADSTDLMSTFADIVGVDLPTGLDGRTLLDDMQQVPGPDKWRRFSHYARRFDITDVTTAAFTRSYKLQRKSNGSVRFFHLISDPLETNPLNTNQLTLPQQTMFDKLQSVIVRYDAIGSGVRVILDFAEYSRIDR